MGCKAKVLGVHPFLLNNVKVSIIECNQNQDTSRNVLIVLFTLKVERSLLERKKCKKISCHLQVVTSEYLNVLFSSSTGRAQRRGTKRRCLPGAGSSGAKRSSRENRRVPYRARELNVLKTICGPIGMKLPLMTCSTARGPGLEKKPPLNISQQALLCT